MEATVAADGKHTAPWLFKRGQSGNPRGRPKEKTTSRGIKDMACQAAPEIMQRLIDMALGKIEVKPEIAVRAAEVVLNRAYGLPRQAVDVNATQTQFVAVLPMPAASAEEWARKAAELNGMKTIEHEFQPAPAVELASADKSSSDNDCKD